MNKLRFLNGFWLKLIAYLFMVIDHVGVFLLLYFSDNASMTPIINVLRCIGRLSFPLILVLLVEGIEHTKNEWKYLLRIGIVTLPIIIIQIITGYTVSSKLLTVPSPINDVFVLCLLLVLLKQKGWKKAFAVIPAVYIVTVYVVQCIEFNDITVTWLPGYLRTSYSLYGLLLCLGFYASKYLARGLAKSVYGYTEKIEETAEFRGLINSFEVAVLLIVNIIILILASYPLKVFIFDPYQQSWAMLAGLFILLYNGQRGYNKKWFQYSCYAFFPVHIILIFLIFYIVLGLPGGF